MKKTLSIFMIIIGTSLYTSQPQPSPRGWRPCPPLVKRPCKKSILDDATSGFDAAYRKSKGNQYFEEAFRPQQQNNTAEERTNQKSQQNLEPLHQQKQRRHSHFFVPPQSTPPSYTHLRTPRNAKEIESLLTIRSILPEIAPATTRITQFDIQPTGSYFYRQ